MSTDTTATAPILVPAQHGVIGVSLDTYHDRSGVEHQVVEVEEAGAVLFALSPSRARRLASVLVKLADQTEPLDREAFTRIVEAAGVTLEEVAADAGIDLETATQADSFLLARTLGERMTGRRDVSVGPGGVGGTPYASASEKPSYSLSEYAEQR